MPCPAVRRSAFSDDPVAAQRREHEAEGHGRRGLPDPALHAEDRHPVMPGPRRPSGPGDQLQPPPLQPARRHQHQPERAAVDRPAPARRRDPPPRSQQQLGRGPGDQLRVGHRAQVQSRAVRRGVLPRSGRGMTAGSGAHVALVRRRPPPLALAHRIDRPRPGNKVRLRLTVVRTARRVRPVPFGGNGGLRIRGTARPSPAGLRAAGLSAASHGPASRGPARGWPARLGARLGVVRAGPAEPLRRGHQPLRTRQRRLHGPLRVRIPVAVPVLGSAILAVICQGVLTPLISP